MESSVFKIKMIHKETVMCLLADKKDCINIFQAVGISINPFETNLKNKI